MPRTRAQVLQDYIRLVVDAGKQDDLSDDGVCKLALDLDPDAIVVFFDYQFEIIFTDRSTARFNQEPYHGCH